MSSPARRPTPRPRPAPAESPAEPPAPPATAQASDLPAVAQRSTQTSAQQSAPSGRARRAAKVVRIARASGRATTGSVAETGRIWRASRTARAQRPRTEPFFDAGSWFGAIVMMAAFTAVPWIVQIVNAALHYRLNRFGLVPRDLHGLWGVLTQPFLHASYADMLSDTLPVLVIGWVVMLAGPRIWSVVTVFVVLVGGALTWLIGPSHAQIIGCATLIFGWLGYLVARAVFSRKIKWIVTAAMVLLVFGALLGQLVPVAHSHEGWQVHVAGFAAGVGIAWLLHPRRNSVRGARRRARAAAVS